LDSKLLTSDVDLKSKQVDFSAKALASPDEVKFIALLLQHYYGEKLQAMASLQRLDTIA
jgi:hypothetical protein